MGLLCQDLMYEGNHVVSPKTTVKEAFFIIKKTGVRYLPVVEDEIYKGVFTSPTLIKLLLPQALTIDLAGKNTDNALSNLSFYNINHDDFKERISHLDKEFVIDYLSDPELIPVAEPKTPIMEGILLLHKYKRHVILAEKETGKYHGVLTINSVLENIFIESEL